MNNDKGGMHRNVKVWDIFVRFFHWSLALLLAAAFLTEDEFPPLHAAAGYVVLFLIAGRILWGFVGTRYVRFTSFLHSPRLTLGYIKEALHLRHARTLGHNPAAGLMVMALLGSTLLAGVTGVALYGGSENAGPLAGMLARSGWRYADALEDIHGFFAWATVWLAVFHVAAAIAESIHFKENLVMSMVTGNKKETITERSKADENSSTDHCPVGDRELPASVGAGRHGARG